MPRMVAGSHRLSVLPSFAEGLCTALDGEPGRCQPRVALEDIDLSLLTSKALTLLMRQQHDEMRVRRQAKKHVRAFMALSFSEQTAVLQKNQVWVYRPSGMAQQPSQDSLDASEAEADGPLDLASEVDWGADSASDLSAKPESLAEEPAVEARSFDAPQLKRRRCKGPPPQHLDLGAVAIIGKSDATSRLSKELQEPVWCFDFGTQLQKPATLQRFGNALDTPPALCLVAARENGNCYFAAKGTNMSASARWLLQEGSSRADVYTRMQLLLSSTAAERVCVPPGSRNIIEEPVKKNARGIDPKDGVAEISLEYAKELNIISEEDGQQDPLIYHPWQFRGILRLGQGGDLGETVLVKGMLMVNASLTELIRLPQSCIKVRSLAPVPDADYGFDLTHHTRQMAAPRLTASLVAMLRMRITMQARACDRAALEKKLDALLKACKAAGLEAMRRNAWGCPPAALEPVEVQELRQGAGRQHTVTDRWAQRRVDIKDIDILAAEDEQEPTAMEELEVEEEELDPHNIQRGTRESVARGSVSMWGAYKSHRRKPRLPLGSPGFTLTALPDSNNGLADRKCHVISGGQAYIGRVVVWRCPCQCPWDMEIWEAVPLPPDFGPIPDDALIVSQKGWANSRLAGGDFDGDLNMISFDQRLLELVQDTAEPVEAVDVEALEKEVVGMIKAAVDSMPVADEEQQREQLFKAGDPASRFQLYKDFCISLPTLRLRGRCCALAERHARCALQDPSPANLHRYFLASMTAHKAMDVPKKYMGHAVVAVMQGLSAAGNITQKTPRSTKALSKGAKGLSIVLPELRRHNTFESSQKWLEDMLGGRTLGAVWLTRRNTVLGLRAGLRIRRILLARQHYVPYYERTSIRSPITEIAGFIAHKLSRTIGSPERYQAAGPEAVAEALRRCRKCAISELGALFRSDCLV